MRQEAPDVTPGLLSHYASTYWELWIENDDDSFQADVKFHYDNIGGIGNEANFYSICQRAKRPKEFPFFRRLSHGHSR